jgi:hypothetical protein
MIINEQKLIEWDKHRREERVILLISLYLFFWLSITMYMYLLIVQCFEYKYWFDKYPSAIYRMNRAGALLLVNIEIDDW